MGKTAIILQVRIASTRLPGKLLLPLCGKSILEHILLRLQCVREASATIVAAPQNSADAIRAVVEQYGVSLFIGSEEDVLERFVDAARHHDVQTVVRATGDNPLVSIEYLDRSVRLHRSENADLTYYTQLPYGSGVEVIDRGALEKSHRLARDPFEREHITQYMYRHSSRFTLVEGVPDQEMKRPDIRLTVDTEEDYEKMCRIYDALYRGAPISVQDAISYIDRV
jgi:spore coat polysaccharide biosynthesis protein SpsF